ncbi:MAG: phosphotransferase, partial [Rhodospirillaceae bacterium]|nr:phosphotransferase [Rhodospirillaceae bacterium]
MAVYTEVSDEELVTFSAEYDIGEALSLTGIAEGVENSNFLLNTGQGPYILTIYEKRVNPDELPFFFQLLEHLSAQGVPCPVPVAGRDGEVLRTLCGKPAAVVTFLAGMWPKRQRVEHCAELGRVLARMHMAAESFPRARPNDLSIEGWR